MTDPSNATIPDAKVAAVNAGTNFRYETVTNGAGEYTLANLPPGTYRIEVEKAGFKKLVRPEVILHVQDALAIAAVLFTLFRAVWIPDGRRFAAFSC